MITFNIVEQVDEIIQYKEKWEALFDSSSHDVSTSYGWTQALINTSLMKNDRVLLIVLKDTERIVSLIPLILRKREKYGLSLTSIFPVAELFNTHSDFLLDGLNEELCDVFFKALFTIGPQWDVFRMQKIAETNPLLGVLKHHLMSASQEYVINRVEPCFYISLGSSYEDYLLMRSYNFRKDLRKKLKKVGKYGSVEYVKQNYFPDFKTAYNHLIEIEKKSWKYNHGTSIASIKMQTSFFKNLCENAYEKGWLHLGFLLLNGQPIAHNLGLLRGTNYYYLKTSYDENYKDVSPSTLLRARLVEELISHNVKEIDFTGEPYEWQRQWTNDFRWHSSLILCNDTIRAKLYGRLAAVKNKIKSRQGNDIRFHDSRALKPEDVISN